MLHINAGSTVSCCCVCRSGCCLLMLFLMRKHFEESCRQVTVGCQSTGLAAGGITLLCVMIHAIGCLCSFFLKAFARQFRGIPLAAQTHVRCISLLDTVLLSSVDVGLLMLGGTLCACTSASCTTRQPMVKPGDVWVGTVHMYARMIVPPSNSRASSVSLLQQQI